MTQKQWITESSILCLTKNSCSKSATTAHAFKIFNFETNSIKPKGKTKMQKAIIVCKTCQKPTEHIAENVAALVGKILIGIECAECRISKQLTETAIQDDNHTNYADDFSWANFVSRENPQ